MAYLGNSPARSFISFERQVFTIVNSQTVYTLDHSVTNENDIRLVINNVVQEPGSSKAYTASGTTLTLSAALVNGTDEMYCVFLGRATATEAPGAGSVGTSQLAANAVTSAKITYPLTTFSSTGIDDNASGNAVTIESSKRVQFTRARSNTLGDSALEILPSDTVAGIGFRMENTNNDLVIEKSSPSGSEAEILRIRIGGGIALGGTGDANTLDDYEEGTWTPSYTASTTGSVSYGSRGGTYTKVGNLVNAWFSLVNFTTTGSWAGDIKITGLPFTCNQTNNVRICNGVCRFYNINTGGNTRYNVTMDVDSGQSYLIFLESGDDTNWTSITAETTSTSYLEGTITYRTDS